MNKTSYLQFDSASIPDEDIENQVSDPLYNDSTWWHFEADVYSVFT